MYACTQIILVMTFLRLTPNLKILEFCTHVRSTHCYLTHTSKIESSYVHVYACTQINLVVIFAQIEANFFAHIFI